LQANKDPGLPEISSAFGHHLHAAGISVTPERSSRFAKSIALVEPRTIDNLYWVARATFLTSHDQIPTFNRIFSHYFQGMFSLGDLREAEEVSPRSTASSGSSERPPHESPNNSDGQSAPQATSATPGESAGHEVDSDNVSALAAVSEKERINDRPFSALTEEELELIAKLVAQLAVVPPSRVGNRRKRHKRGEEWDIRATLRKAHRTGGDPIHRVLRRKDQRPRKIVLLADVSGSMEPYARVYLHFMRGAVRTIDAEAFVFATQLSHITRSLRMGQVDIAYEKTAEVATDWSGGTRIAGSIQEFINSFGRRGMARGSVVVIVSDGWETGDPSELARTMQQLSLLAHHIIWVNPRKASVDYQPLVGGMAAALPYIDTFLSGHSLAALDQVMQAIRGAGDRASLQIRVTA
jgi:uncharacterized protein